MTASQQARFEDLLARHVGIVVKVVQTYCRLPEDQQDLAQEIKLQLWRAFGKYDDRRAFSTWMYRIALNTAISWNRRSSLRSRYSADFEDVGEQVSPSPFNEDLQALHQLIDGLDPLNRAVLLLYLEDMSHAEIGEVLGITATHAATKLSRIKQELRQEALRSDSVHD